LLHECRQGDHLQGKRWQLTVNPGEQGLELRNYVNQQYAGDQAGNHQDRNGVGHGLFNPGIELLALFAVDRYPVQQGLQRTRLFARGHKGAVQLIEVARLFTQRLGQTGAGCDVLFQVLYQLTHRAVVEAFVDDIEGLQKGDSGSEQRGQLASEQRDVSGFNRMSKAWQHRGVLAHTARADALLA